MSVMTEEQAFAAQLETILAKLLVDDNAVIQQATAELKEVVKHPLIPDGLCAVARNSSNPATRQYAAVLLRKYFARKRWTTLPFNRKEGIKNQILEGILQEQDKTVYTALTVLAGFLAKYELENNEWPALLQLINSQISNADASVRQTGFMTLCTVSDLAGEHLMQYFGELLNYFKAALQEDSLSSYYVLLTLQHLVPYIGSNQSQGMQSLVPHMLVAVRYVIGVDLDKGVEVLDVFEDLVECEVSVLAPYMRHLVELCLEVAADQKLDDAIRAKALNTIQFVINQKKRVVLKQNLIPPILNVVFTLLCAPQPDDLTQTEDDDDDDDDDATPRTCASQTLDSLAINLPPEKVITPTVEWIAGKLSSTVVSDRRGALLALAVICEGAADHIMVRHLETFLRWVCPAIRDERLSIRKEALFALGQMSEHLQPNITKYSAELLPLLFDLLGNIAGAVNKGEPIPPSSDRVFYALEMFCQNLEEELTPHLPPLLQTLLSLLQEPVPLKIQMHALSALDAAATACKDELSPYFEQILGNLQRYLQIQNEADSKEEQDVQMQALGTLATMARTMKEAFQPIAIAALELGLALIKFRDDAEVRKWCFSLFGALSTVLKQDMQQFLDKIVPAMLDGIKFSEFCISNGTTFDVFENLSDSEGSEDLEELESNADDDDDIAVYNAALEEKVEACAAVKEIATEVGGLFLPYLEETSAEVFKLIDHSYEDIRRVAIEATTALTIYLHKNSPEKQQILKDSVISVVPRFVDVVEQDDVPQVAMTALEGLAELLNELGPTAIVGENFLDLVVNAVTLVLKGKSQCQLAAEDDGDADGEEEAPEQEAMLFEYAGEVVPALLNAAPFEKLAPTFNFMIPLLMKKANKSNSVAERSYSVGCLAEIVVKLDENVAPWKTPLLQLFMSTIKDKNEEVRSNSAYGLGVISPECKAEFGNILNVLSDAISTEQAPRCIDNICAAVARMITANVQAVPVDKVLPVLVENLPLKDDLEENDAIYECLTMLFRNKHPVVLPLLPKILHATCLAISSKKVEEECKMKLLEFVRALKCDYPSEFLQSLQMFPPEIQTQLNSFVA